MLRAHAFADGAYLRSIARDHSLPCVNPHGLGVRVLMRTEIQTLLPHRPGNPTIVLMRTTYYDAKPDKEAEVPAQLREYWDAVELLPDTELGFGSLRGGRGKRSPRQKGVDTLIAVDMLVGAYNRIFDVAILIAGDADFVPVVDEVRRRGIMVILAADERSLAQDLRRAADRFVSIGPSATTSEVDWFPALKVNEHTFSAI